MPPDMFEHLESADPREGEVQQVVARLNPFEHIEIGDSRPAVPLPSKGLTGILCPHCHQVNEKERETCWACFKSLREEEKKPAPEKGKGSDEITLVIDGNTYRSGDPDTPDDIRELMDRIRARGYSQELLVEWQNWRATRNIQAQRQTEAEEDDVKVFKGQRVSVIRLDGKVYTSDDPALSPEMKRLFNYLERNGATPELMDQLRRLGGKVKFRPAATATPSDGDLTFWQDVAANRRGAVDSGGVARNFGLVLFYLIVAFVLLLIKTVNKLP